MPDATTEGWSYNANGQVAGYTNGLSQTILYVYDDAGKLTTVDYPTGTDTTFAYDGTGRRTSMVDSTGTTSWIFDNAGQISSFTAPQGGTTYTYNSAGQRTAMTENGLGTSTYAYDTYGRLASLTNRFSEMTSFAYDSLGRVERETKHNGEYTLLSFDSRGRVSTLANKKSDNSVLSLESYIYDNASNMTSKTVDGVVTSYTYDNINQLLSESKTGYSCSYTYDGNGNRTSRTLNGVLETYTNDPGDKLTSVAWSGGSRNFSYDACGRRISETSSAGTTSYSYDYESRISGITYPNTSTNSFSYNGMDTRVGKTDSEGTKTFMRDGAYATSPVLSDGSASYTPGVSERRGITTSYFMTDYLGSHKGQTISNQTVSATRSFDAFGNLVSSSGSSSSPFGFAGDWGYQTDGNSGLQLLGHRYYDPSVGRFLTRDPVKDGRTWYGYCGNNPVRRVDPKGLSWIRDRLNDIGIWFGGTDVIGPGGEPVRVGGWPAIFNYHKNAITINETVHLNDWGDYENYINNKNWSQHERVHIFQEEEYHGGNAIDFVGTVLWQYLLAGTHGGATYEIEANEATKDWLAPKAAGLYALLRWR